MGTGLPIRLGLLKLIIAFPRLQVSSILTVITTSFVNIGAKGNINVILADTTTLGLNVHWYLQSLFGFRRNRKNDSMI